MRVLTTLFAVFVGWTSFGQIDPSKRSHDFGEIYSGAPTYIDIQFTNKSPKTQFLLTIDKPQGVSYIFSGKKMLADSSIIIRMNVNDQQKGRFNYEVDLYFSHSNDPITVRLSGNIKETNSNFLTDCPDFSSTPSSYNNNFDIAVKVIDSLTGMPLKNAMVYFVERGELIGEHKTNSKGFVKRKVPMGYYYITASKQNYQNNFREHYFNFQRKYCEIPLQKLDQEEELLVNEETEIEEGEEEVEEQEEEVIVIDESDTDSLETTVEIVDPTPLEDLPDSLFDDLHFHYNNITFILDVSSSMNAHNKFDLLKLSMIELIKILRPEDAVSILKYSAEVTAIMEQEHGDNSDYIIQTVKDLRTSGMTAGGDAIKAAYRISKKGYLPDDNNIVIMITDGLFNRGDKDYLKTVASNYKSKGIKFSVVGIKTADYVTKQMEEVVAEGGGSFIQIRNFDDARTKIIAEIKRTSFKN